MCRLLCAYVGTALVALMPGTLAAADDGGVSNGQSLSNAEGLVTVEFLDGSLRTIELEQVGQARLAYHGGGAMQLDGLQFVERTAGPSVWRLNVGGVGRVDVTGALNYNAQAVLTSALGDATWSMSMVRLDRDGNTAFEESSWYEFASYDCPAAVESAGISRVLAMSFRIPQLVAFSTEAQDPADALLVESDPVLDTDPVTGIASDGDDPAADGGGTADGAVASDSEDAVAGSGGGGGGGSTATTDSETTLTESSGTTATTAVETTFDSTATDTATSETTTKETTTEGSDDSTTVTSDPPDSETVDENFFDPPAEETTLSEEPAPEPEPTAAVEAVQNPEPGTIVLMGIALALVGVCGRGRVLR